MMTRTVIGFVPAGKSIYVSLDRAPGVFEPNSAKINLEKLPGNTIMQRGEALVKMLIKRDPIKSGLSAALALPAGSAPSPLYFHVRASAADSISWEQIYAAPHGFCALDPRWPVARIAERIRDVRGRAFKPPLRIVAVLSAAGRNGVPQLDAFLTAVSHAEIATRLHVISGDEDLLAKATGAGVTAECIAGSSPDLCRQIVAAKPHVLHLLCHGRAVAGVRTLAFGTLPDFYAEQQDIGSLPLPVTEQQDFGSLPLPVTDLVGALEGCDPWLVVLSACETAEAADMANGRALAHAMVSDGVTAVVGMRRLVDLHDMNRFCKALYPEVIAVIRAAVTPASAGQPEKERVIDWASVLTNPRKVLSGTDPSALDTWLDPVLYVQNDDMRVFPPSEQLSPDDYAKLQGKLDKYRGFLASQDLATAKPEAIAEVRALIADAEAILKQAGA
jgi:hypothetical protein